MIQLYLIQVDITNTGNQEMKLASITGLPDNLEYTITDYNIGDKLCQNDKCSLGFTKTIIINIKYKDGAITSTSTTYNLNLNFEFKKFTNSYLNHQYPNFPSIVSLIEPIQDGIPT